MAVEDLEKTVKTLAKLTHWSYEVIRELVAQRLRESSLTVDERERFEKLRLWNIEVTKELSELVSTFKLPNDIN